MVINKSKRSKTEYHHFAATNEVMDLSSGFLETALSSL